MGASTITTITRKTRIMKILTLRQQKKLMKYNNMSQSQCLHKFKTLIFIINKLFQSPLNHSHISSKVFLANNISLKNYRESLLKEIYTKIN